jgi:hypothetical protein
MYSSYCLPTRPRSRKRYLIEMKISNILVFKRTIQYRSLRLLSNKFIHNSLFLYTTYSSLSYW